VAEARKIVGRRCIREKKKQSEEEIEQANAFFVVLRKVEIGLSKKNGGK